MSSENALENLYKIQTIMFETGAPQDILDNLQESIDLTKARIELEKELDRKYPEECSYAQ